jgi:hypothetical protein
MAFSQCYGELESVQYSIPVEGSMALNSSGVFETTNGLQERVGLKYG